MRKHHKERINRGLLFAHFPLIHTWRKMKREDKEVILKDTKWGRLVGTMSAYRCLVCGREEYEETDDSWGIGPKRHWEEKPTPEDTTKELFDVPK